MAAHEDERGQPHRCKISRGGGGLLHRQGCPPGRQGRHPLRPTAQGGVRLQRQIRRFGQHQRRGEREIRDAQPIADEIAPGELLVENPRRGVEHAQPQLNLALIRPAHVEFCLTTR